VSLEVASPSAVGAATVDETQRLAYVVGGRGLEPVSLWIGALLDYIF
jgi:hypothetical protein